MKNTEITYFSNTFHTASSPSCGGELGTSCHMDQKQQIWQNYNYVHISDIAVKILFIAALKTNTDNFDQKCSYIIISHSCYL